MNSEYKKYFDTIKKLVDAGKFRNAINSINRKLSTVNNRAFRNEWIDLLERKKARIQKKIDENKKEPKKEYDFNILFNEETQLKNELKLLKKELLVLSKKILNLEHARYLGKNKTIRKAALQPLLDAEQKKKEKKSN